MQGFGNLPQPICSGNLISLSPNRPAGDHCRQRPALAGPGLSATDIFRSKKRRCGTPDPAIVRPGIRWLAMANKTAEITELAKAMVERHGVDALTLADAALRDAIINRDAEGIAFRRAVKDAVAGLRPDSKSN